MTVKWVKVDPLVMNGEPFCYNSRLSVRNLLEMRAAGLTWQRMIAENPELRRVGIATAFAYAGDHRERYAAFFEADGSLAGPGFTSDEAAALPEPLRKRIGVVVSEAPAAVPSGRLEPAQT
jgi:uncharacterized protein (DUF433 family)